MTDAGRATVARRIRTQQRACAELGSPLYASILDAAAADVEAGGPVWDVLTGHEDDPGPSALALRLLGGVHRLVLSGGAPELAARWYPSAGGDGDPAEAWPAFRATVAEHVEHLRDEVQRGVQTNEVGRCSALVGGFLAVAKSTGLPLRVLEVGTSGGLNLRWDHYRYRSGARSWGDPRSLLDLGDPYIEGQPPLDVATTVVARRGCDLSPVDPTTEGGCRTLLSFVWPDQALRFRNLEAAIEIARAVPAAVDTASAPSWIVAQLDQPATGMATVVFHSVVMQYLAAEDRAAFEHGLVAAGERAEPAAPIAWLRMEPAPKVGLWFAVTLTTWPGGDERTIAHTGAHGQPVRWLG